MTRLRAIAVLAVLAPAAAHATDLDVTVTGIHNDRGVVRVALCDQADFPKGPCQFRAHDTARPGRVTVHLTGVLPGTYAAVAYHDEANAAHIDYTWYGAPKQGFGFSNDAKMNYGPPRFADAAISVGSTNGTITLPLHYPQ